MNRFSVIRNSEIESNVEIHDQVNLFKCHVGKNCKIDSFVYIEEGVNIGSNTKIRPFVFLPTGVSIEDGVFIGPNVTFTNDKYPRIGTKFKLLRTRVRTGASIGAGSVILPGVTVGAHALVGAGSVVTKNVDDFAVVVGNPAKKIGVVYDQPGHHRKRRGHKLIDVSLLAREGAQERS